MFLKLCDYIEQIFFNLKSAQQTFKNLVICLVEQFVFSFFS